MSPKILPPSLLLLVSLTGCIADLGIDAPEAPNACDPEGLDVLLDAFPPCDLDMCGDDEADRMRGRCVDVNQVPAGQRDLLGPCATTNARPYASLCVPVGMLIYDGRHKPTVCTSLGGLEGRCTSECVPQVREQGVVLPVDVCGEGERCAPCYDPTTFESTGACETSHCDAPVDPEPDFCAWDYDENPIVDTSALEPCPSSICDQPSHCMPNSLVPEAQRDLLPECDAAHKCVPDTILASGGNAPGRTCTSIGGTEGRCQSTCIPDVAHKADMLPVSVCDADTERCAPCYDPTTGLATGACETACDMPEDPPYLFPGCCANIPAHDAICVPEEAIPGDTTFMSRGSCETGNKCVPRRHTDPCYRPQACSNNFGNGFCISDCITTIGGGDDSCPAGTGCVACPIAGDAVCDPIPEWCP